MFSVFWAQGSSSQGDAMILETEFDEKLAAVGKG
jgi:hypothetical protein